MMAAEQNRNDMDDAVGEKVDDYSRRNRGSTANSASDQNLRIRTGRSWTYRPIPSTRHLSQIVLFARPTGGRGATAGTRRERRLVRTGPDHTTSLIGPARTSLTTPETSVAFVTPEMGWNLTCRTTCRWTMSENRFDAI